MKRIQVLFEAWMNSHSDNGQIKEAYKQLEQNDLQGTVVLPEMQKYLLQLEKQAFYGGFVVGIQLAVECLGI